MAASAPSSSIMALSGERVVSAQLEGVCLMKLIQHCHDALPKHVSGAVLGIDMDGHLQATNSFPYLQSDEEAQLGWDYQLEMLKAARSVHVDNQIVGWYTSCSMGSWISRDTVKTQYEYQSAMGPNALMFVYDAVRSLGGSLSIRCFRLSDAFMAAYESQSLTLESMKQVSLSASSIFEEVPLRIRNSHLATALLAQLQKVAKKVAGQAGYTCPTSIAAEGSVGGAADFTFDRLDLSATHFIHKNLTSLTTSVGELASQQGQLQQYERRLANQMRLREEWLLRRREENKERVASGMAALPETDTTLWFNKPLQELRTSDRLDLLLNQAQTAEYCDQVNKFASQSFGKLFLASSLQQCT